MKIQRREFLRLGGAVAALPVLPRAACAVDYPTRPVRLIVPYPAGIAPDIVARLVAQPLSQRFNQQFIVDNRAGAARNVAGELFKEMAGIDLVNVPYRGNYLPDLIAGQVHASFTPTAQSMELIKSGRLRALALTGTTRSDSLPEVPTAAEFVPGY